MPPLSVDIRLDATTFQSAFKKLGESFAQLGSQTSDAMRAALATADSTLGPFRPTVTLGTGTGTVTTAPTSGIVPTYDLGTVSIDNFGGQLSGDGVPSVYGVGASEPMQIIYGPGYAPGQEMGIPATSRELFEMYQHFYRDYHAPDRREVLTAILAGRLPEPGAYKARIQAQIDAAVAADRPALPRRAICLDGEILP